MTLIGPAPAVARRADTFLLLLDGYIARTAWTFKSVFSDGF